MNRWYKMIALLLLPAVLGVTACGAPAGRGTASADSMEESAGIAGQAEQTGQADQEDQSEQGPDWDPVFFICLGGPGTRLILDFFDGWAEFHLDLRNSEKMDWLAHPNLRNSEKMDRRSPSRSGNQEIVGPAPSGTGKQEKRWARPAQQKQEKEEKGPIRAKH